jgi:NAD-dependent dihydropyrimidine dehydrogenase PreA subunit
MKKKIISINEDLCKACGNCVSSCHQGAIQIINGKAKLVNENFCDGLGLCIGECPSGALKIIEKEIEEKKAEEKVKPLACGCPGTMVMDRRSGCSSSKVSVLNPSSKLSSSCACGSELRQWPVQLHLVPATAPFLKNSELVVLSSCSAVATPEIHSKLIKNRAVVMACPKLDNTEGYLEKLRDIFSTADTPKVIIALMAVPCCNGLLSIVTEAARLSDRKDLVIEKVVVSLDGNLGDPEELTY